MNAARRLPALLALLALLAGVVAIDRLAPDADDVAVSVASVTEGVATAVSPESALESVFFCIGPPGFDQTVLVANPTDASRIATVAAGVQDESSGDDDSRTARTVELAPNATEAVAIGEGAATGSLVTVEIEGGDVAVAQRLTAVATADPIEEDAAEDETPVEAAPAEALQPCVSKPSDTWYFPVVSTASDASATLLVANPSSTTISVDIVAVTRSEGIREPQSFEGMVVPKNGVLAVDLGSGISRRDEFVAIVTARSGRVVAGIVQSFGAGTTGAPELEPEPELGEPPVFGEPGFAEALEEAATSTTAPPTTVGLLDDELALGDPGGLTFSIGAPGSATAWTAPAGGGALPSIERVVIFNPSDERAELDVEFFSSDRTAEADEALEVTVFPNGLEIIDVGEQFFGVSDAIHTITARSANGVPFVVGRMSSDGTVSAVAVASPAGATRWLVPDQGPQGAIVVANAAVVAATVDIAGIGGSSSSETVELAPGETAVVPTASSSTPIDVTSDQLIVVDYVERAPSGALASIAAAMPAEAALELLDPAIAIPDAATATVTTAAPVGPGTTAVQEG